MEKKNILYIHHNNYDIGGSDYCLFKMVREINRSEDINAYVLLRLETDVVNLYKEENIPVIIKPIYRIQKTKNPIALLTYLYKIPFNIFHTIRVIQKYNIDLVHTNDLLDFSGNLAAKIMRLPSCQHIRMIVTKPKILQYLLSKFCLISSLKILCVSDAVRQYMFPNNLQKCDVVFDWLDQKAVKHISTSNSLKQELSLDENTKIIGCVGRLEEWKGQHVFLEAIDFISEKNPETHFILVGGGVKGKEEYVEKLYKIHKNLKYKNKVTFLGHRNDIASIMSQLDIMVHASISPDPLPGVVMEAMTNQTVVVGANDGGVPEELTDGINGFLYKAGNSQHMAEKVNQVLNFHDQLEEIGVQAQLYVNKKFNKKTIVIQLQKIYSEMMEN